jgi:hypothetical protein
LDREEQYEDGAESEVGKGKADQGDHAQGAILPPVAMQRGPDAGGDRSRNADKESGDRESKGVRVALKDEVGDGVVEAKRLAEIHVEQTVPVVGVLLRERRVESIGVAEGIDVGGGSAFAKHLNNGVAGNKVD